MTDMTLALNICFETNTMTYDGRSYYPDFILCNSGEMTCSRPEVRTKPGQDLRLVWLQRPHSLYLLPLCADSFGKGPVVEMHKDTALCT